MFVKDTIYLMEIYSAMKNFSVDLIRQISSFGLAIHP